MLYRVSYVIEVRDSDKVIEAGKMAFEADGMDREEWSDWTGDNSDVEYALILLVGDGAERLENGFQIIDTIAEPL